MTTQAADQSLALGIDVGGTKIAAGLVDSTGRIVARLRRKTPSENPVATELALAEVITTMLAEAGAVPVVGIGVGAPGIVDETRSIVRLAPNMAWRDEHVRDKLSARIGRDLVVENDANAAAWAEYRFGAGRGVDHLVIVTVGTGVGGGLVLDGRLYRGRFGLAAEFGHMCVEPGGRACGCGRNGCWERYASGSALVLEAKTRATAEPHRATALLASCGGDAAAITGPAVADAAKAGDLVALESFEAVGTWLGRGLATLSAALDPGRFVIGGGVAENGELLLGPARAAFSDNVMGAGLRPVIPVLAAELGNDAGIVGAADLARS